MPVHSSTQPSSPVPSLAQPASAPDATTTPIQPTSQALSVANGAVETPRFKADAEMANLYADALSGAAATPPLFTLASPGVGPIPVDSTFAQWRQHLDSLLTGDDFKQWANDHGVDLTKPVSIFPPRQTTPGFINATLKPVASERSRTPTTRAFGPRFGSGLALPASWSLIMHAADTLGPGRTAISVTPAGQSSPQAHAARPARLEEVAAFYGESIPDTQAGLQQRANTLKQADAFPLPDTHLPAAQFELRTETALENQQREMGDISNTFRLSRLLSTAAAPAASATETTATGPTFLEAPLTPEQAAQAEKTSIAATLENTLLKVDPASWYFQDKQLTPDAKVTLKQFIIDNEWRVPQTRDEVANLMTFLQQGPLPQIPHGNLTGAMGWAAPLAPEEKKQLYSHVRYNNLDLPGLDAQTRLEIKGGAFNYLTKNRHWTAAELSNPRQVIQDILDSPKALALEHALQQKMEAIGNTDAREWTLGAMVVGLDSTALFDPHPRNHTADFNLAAPRYYGKPLNLIKQGLIDHLVQSQRSTREMAPIAAHLLLSHAAPELLVKGIPPGVTYGSPAWFSLRATVASIEAKSPGLGSHMSFAEVVKYAAIEPVSSEDQAIQSAVRREVLIDWALVHGILQPSATGDYSAEQLSTASTTFSAVMNTLQKTASDLKAEVPLQKNMALDVLGQRFKNVSFEKAVITHPYSKTNNALDNDVLHVKTGPYSLLDMYLSEHVYDAKALQKWYSTDATATPSQAVHLLGELPDSKTLHAIALADYRQGIEQGLVNLTKHLIAQLPLEDRKSLEYGQLEVFMEGTVIQHSIPARSGTLNANRDTPEQLPSKRSLIVKSTHEGSVRCYEFCPQHNVIKRRDDLETDFKTGPQGPWVKQDPGYLGGQKSSNTAIVHAEVPAADQDKLAAASAGTQVPASYTSARSQLLGELLSRHTCAAFGFDQLQQNTRHNTRFDEEDHQLEGNKELVLGVIPFVPLIRKAINGDVLGVASELIFDGIMYMTTAGLGKTARAAKPLSGLARKAGVPFGKRLFERVVSSTSQGLTDSVNALRPGRTGSYGLSKTVSRPDIAQGTYKKGLVELSTPAKLDEKTGKWFAYDPLNHRSYGKSLDNFTPKASAWVDDALPTTGKPTALEIGLGRDNVIQMGGSIQKFNVIDNEVYTFVDTYKGLNRLNITAHGKPYEAGKKLFGKNAATLVINQKEYTAADLVDLLKSKGYDPASYDNVRLLVCHSAEGGSKSFGHLLQKQIKKPVKAFEGPVAVTFNPTYIETKRVAYIDDFKKRAPDATQAFAEKQAEIKLQQDFVRKFQPEVNKNHGSFAPVNIAPPGQRPIIIDLPITYRPVKFGH